MSEIVIIHRGIICLDTFPPELIWNGIYGTGLECANCIYYASDPKSKVFIGLCVNCANMYNGKYGCGFYGDLKGMTENDIPVAFGNIPTDIALNSLSEIESPPQVAINPKTVFSIYNLALLSTNDIQMLITSNDGWQRFKNYYKTSDKNLYIILDTVSNLRFEYELDNAEILKSIVFNKEFYYECNKLEKQFIDYLYNDEICCYTNYENIEITNQYYCNFCKIRKTKRELKKCGNCKEVRYCSIDCQKQDWKYNHKQKCMTSQNIEDVD